MPRVSFNILDEKQARRASERWTEFIYEDVSRVTTARAQRTYIPRLVETVRQAGIREGDRLFNFIANRLIGKPVRDGNQGPNVQLQGHPGAPVPIFRRVDGQRVQQHTMNFRDITWMPLSERYRQWKRSKGKGWFEHTGALQRFFADESANDLFGTPVVRFVKTEIKPNVRQDSKKRLNRRVIGRIVATVFPSLNSSNLPFLRSGDVMDVYTRTAFGGMIPPEVRKKTQGKNASVGSRIKRPLIQPVLNWYIANRIPGAMNAAIYRAGGGRK